MERADMTLDMAEIDRGAADSYEVPNSVCETLPAPLVTVRTYTYQHGPYIRECIEGVLAQKTSFPFEYIIGEDFSTDGTREIVLDYAARYPNIIRVVTADRNVGGLANVHRCRARTRGKYTTLCEGDDYWISPLKLQRQVDFMEARPDVSLCFHNALILNERYAAVRLFFETPPAELLDFEAVYQLTLPTPSLMMRSELMANAPPWQAQIWCGDLFLRLWYAHHGKFGYLDQPMAIYRRHSGGLETGLRTRGRNSYYDDVFRTLREFDKSTEFAHTALIQRELARLQEDQLRQRLGRRYFLLRPRYLVTRLQQYRNWLSHQKHLSG
jgi:glycosyltransferase involved in cell wall biosynthesis